MLFSFLNIMFERFASTSQYRCFSFKRLAKIRPGLFFFSFLLYSCQSYILFVSTSNSFCNKGFQNLLSLLGGITEGETKKKKRLYIILSFQILPLSAMNFMPKVCVTVLQIPTRWKKLLHPIKSTFTFGVNVGDEWGVIQSWRKIYWVLKVFRFEILCMFSS